MTPVYQHPLLKLNWLPRDLVAYQRVQQKGYQMGGKKRKQVEEELKPKAPQITALMDKSDMDATEFLCFLPDDAIYSTKAHNLQSEKLKLIMREILKQLNALRYLSFKQFWATIQFNVALRKCLESCLMYFQRKKYNQYLRHTEQLKPNPDNEVVEYQKHLFHILLAVYFRMLQAEDEDSQLSKEFKCYESIYESWIFDIPKVFNFMDIYGESNRDITKLLVEKVFEVNENYRLDFIDTLEIVGKKIFPEVMQQIKFIHDRSEFDKSVTQLQLKKKMKVFLTLKDIFSSLLNSFEFFPLEVSVNIITYTQILIPLENVYYELFVAYKNWPFDKFTDKMRTLIDAIQVDVVAVWVKIFQTFKSILLEESDMSYIKGYGEIKKSIVDNLNRMLEEFGTVTSQGKKGKDKRNYMLLEQIMRTFALGDMLQELTALQIKNFNYGVLKEISKVVQNLENIKKKRLEAEEEGEEGEHSQNSKGDDEVEEQSQNQTPQSNDSTKKPSIKSILSAEQKQNKEDAITKRMDNVRKPMRVQKTNEREYDDEYDDFHDYNRKYDENRKQDSDSEVEDIPQNPNRHVRLNRQDSDSNPGNKASLKSQGNQWKQKKEDRSDRVEHKDSGKNNNNFNYKRGGDRGQKIDSRGAKKHYREK